ncbi:MAG: hypothetical protein IJM96_03985 [Clostridia bacterium]|nr:hypothetical protein [Clostridia bacterium]
MGKIFKKSLMGFSKEQVIAYIDNLVDKQKAALEEEKEKYTQLQEENEKLINERDNAVEVAKADLQAEMDEINAQNEDIKNENAALVEANEKLQNEKNELFESIKSIKAQLNDYIEKEKSAKEKIEGLENENKVLALALEREKSIGKIDVSSYQAEIESLRAKNAQLEAQIKTKTVVPAMKIEENTEEVWESLKDKINGLATDFNDLADTVKAEETRENESKKISIRDILERVKRIGDKI